MFGTEEAVRAAAQIGYPVLVRPSYVLGGQGMVVAYDEDSVREYMSIINMNEQEYPILIDKYIAGKELEIDAICDGDDILIPSVMEHVEASGIHSGDSICMYPVQSIGAEVCEKIYEISKALAQSLDIKGLMNIQFIYSGGEIYVIEVNPRSSRTIPYISKITGLPVVELAARAALGEKLSDMGYGTGIYKTPDVVCVKMPVFSFESSGSGGRTWA